MGYFFQTILLLISGTSFAFRTGPNQPDWRFLKEQYRVAPDRNVMINVSWSLVALTTKFYTDARLVLDLTQTWKDERVNFNGTEIIPVPPFATGYFWLPDTVVDNSLHDTVRLQTLHVSPEGYVILRQRRDLEIICENKNTCRVVLRSYALSAVESITYVAYNANTTRNARITEPIMSEEVKYNTLEIEILPTNSKYYSSFSL